MKITNLQKIHENTIIYTAIGAHIFFLCELENLPTMKYTNIQISDDNEIYLYIKNHSQINSSFLDVQITSHQTTKNPEKSPRP